MDKKKISKNYSVDEMNAINQKAENISKKVICPRCGRELVFIGNPHGYIIKCETEGCLKEVVRGL